MEPWAARIKESLDAQGYTQAELARACKLGAGSISGWFGQGKPTKMISGDNLVAAASFLGLSAEFIMTGRGSGARASTGSQAARLDDETIEQGLQLLYLLADARPDDPRFERPTWPMIRVAAKAAMRAEGSPREAMAEIISELSKEI